MERDQGPSAEGAASFHTTRWTIVMRAAESQAQGGQSALAELCRLYWYPLYIFARLRGHLPDDAQDLTQGFFLHVVEHRAFTGVDRLKGKFRSFLLASFQNYLSDAGDRARRLKRGKRRRQGVCIPGCRRGRRTHALCEALVASEGWLGP